MATATPLDPVLEALARAPIGEEDLSDEELAELHLRAEDMRLGRVQPIEHADVQRTIAGMRKLAG